MKEIPKGYEYLFLKNGKAKKKYCYCLNEGKRQMQRLYGQPIIQCFGLCCPYYPIGCGRHNIKQFEEGRGEN